ncbi:MAG TPA: hypothetical protein VKR21_08630 [Solirubrobacteraceae bacterium]|nr:hypothetical protein [Solirubrobacteraceae bacterium]
MRWWLAPALALIAGLAAAPPASGFDLESVAGAELTNLLSPAPGRGATLITVHDATVGRPIPPGFVGLSLEYPTIEPYAGGDPAAVNPVLVHLIAGLAPGQRPVLRIGGDSTDWAWWPFAHMRKPVGIRIVLTPRTAAVLGALAGALRARLILGINLEANSQRLAALEARQLIRRVGPRWVEALEIGNEPELYGRWPWLDRHGHRVIARPAGYDLAGYIRDFRGVAGALPPVGLAGPALGGPRWIRSIGEFIAGAPRLRVVTVHTYPLQRCYTPLVAPTYPTIAHLLAPSASRGLAGRLAAAVAVAHAHGLPLRVDEMNSVSCGGAHRVSDTFASALWALDTMFALARVGVDGVNLHTFQTATYRLFGTARRAGRWRASVAPEYYGLLLFARSAPPGSRLLRVSGAAGSLRAWATRTPAGSEHIVLINDSERARVIVVQIPGRPGWAAYEALRAPGFSSRSGISLGGVGFGSFTETGVLPAPDPVRLHPVDGGYVLRVPGASAVTLSLPARSPGL